MFKPVLKFSLTSLAVMFLLGCNITATKQAAPQFNVSVKLDKNTINEAIDGRMFLLVHTNDDKSPREVASMLFAASAENPKWGRYSPLFGSDVDDLQPGSNELISNDKIQGYPFNNFSEVPAGDYYIQAVFNRYTTVTRDDGHTIKVAMDHWDGQQFHISPGNLYSEVKKVHIDPAKGFDINLTLSEIIPPIELAPDTKFVKRLKFKSKLVSDFWNYDMYVGATVRLPKSYYENPDKKYPVLYWQGHFQEKDRAVIPEQRPTESGPQQIAYDAWAADDAAQMIVVTFQHPTPFYDDSYAVNSANNGPYGDAMLQEMIPAVEDSFRIIKQPWARVLTGGSTGGWISAALQIYHPKFFGGTWSFCPDSLDFSRYQLINLYEDDNAFYVPSQEWVKTPQFMSRSVEGNPLNTVQRASQLGRALGNNQRSAEIADTWNGVYSPAGSDGYPMPVWDHNTGEINKEVVAYWRDNGFDLNHYLQKNWDEIGSDLQGKLHFACGDMDQFYLNLAMYKMETFLESTESPPYEGWFKFYPRKGHSLVGYQNTLKDLMQEMLVHIKKNAPQGTNTTHWNLP